MSLGFDLIILLINKTVSTHKRYEIKIIISNQKLNDTELWELNKNILVEDKYTKLMKYIIKSNILNTNIAIQYIHFIL